MKNPYDVLGIPQNADAELLRERYRKLMRDYDGDPRRVDELNNAYDAIVLSRGSARQQSPPRQGYAADFEDIRRQIAAARFDDAIMLLDGVSTHQRTAEWYYLKGCAQRGRGWLEEAENNFAQATRQAPENREYRAAYDQMRANRQGGYRQRREQDEGSGCCKVCAALWCADTCCECSGGDLIRCC